MTSHAEILAIAITALDSALDERDKARDLAAALWDEQCQRDEQCKPAVDCQPVIDSQPVVDNRTPNTTGPAHD